MKVLQNEKTFTIGIVEYTFSLCEIRIYTRDCSRESQNPNLGQCASQSDSPDKDFLISDKGEYTFNRVGFIIGGRAYHSGVSDCVWVWVRLRLS